jgi:catechol 2,3-dioxygenase-like lactoylglutathione lyase family enzyme
VVLVGLAQIGLLEDERHAERTLPEVDGALSGRTDERDVVNALDLDLLHEALPSAAVDVTESAGLRTGGANDFPATAPWEHIYFAVDDLEETCRRAEGLGGLSTDEGDGGLLMGRIATRPWGERSFYLRDPFGNPLCFVDAGTLFTGTPGGS